MASSSGKAIGILGGTFDPIHYGHLRPALEVLERLGLAEIRFIPCRYPPHRKPPVASPEQRLAMVRQAIAEQPGFMVDDCELRRDGPSYMVDTLESLRHQLGKRVSLCLLLGADAFNSLPQWHRWQALSELTHLVVLLRPGTADPAAELLDEGIGWYKLADATSLGKRPSGGILLQTVTQLGISSTRIRQLLAAGRSPRFLLPDKVLAYIRDQNLYRTCSLSLR